MQDEKGNYGSYSLSLSRSLSPGHRARPPGIMPTRTLFVQERGVKKEHNWSFLLAEALKNTSFLPPGESPHADPEVGLAGRVRPTIKPPNPEH